MENKAKFNFSIVSHDFPMNIEDDDPIHSDFSKDIRIRSISFSLRKIRYASYEN